METGLIILQHTNGLVKGACNCSYLLPIKIVQQFATEPELFNSPIILSPFPFAMFLRRISISQVLGRWWMYFPLRTAHCLWF